MIRRMYLILWLLPMVWIHIGCSAKQGGQHVTASFAYPDSPEVVEHESTRLVQSLSGIVENPQGDALDKVLVEVLSTQTHTRLDAKLSGKDGKFVFAAPKPKESLILKFSKPGFNTVIIHVTVDRQGVDRILVTLPFSA